MDHVAATAQRRDDAGVGRTRASMSVTADIVEAWAQGYMVGSLIILILLVVCNYRRGVLLHKLILLEMMLALLHGTFIFVSDPVYDWYLSATAVLLFISYQVHNVVSYLKIRLFLPTWGRRVFLGTLALVQPFWVLETYTNFAYFNGNSSLDVYTRPWEPLAREPWWIFTTCWLIWQCKSKYDLKAMELLKLSPRFGIMILCMVISITFAIVDVVVTADHSSAATGVNPFWRFTLVFKAAADTIFLDDFKQVLDKIIARRTGGLLSEAPVSSPLASPNRERRLSPSERF